MSKARLDRFGHASGSKPIARGALYLMLQNRIYRGEIVHKDTAYPGLHEAIIDEALWDDVQAALAENRVERITRSKAVAPSLLAGLVYDANGERMSPTYANKKGTRYRYYVSQSLIKRSRPQASETACRVPAADLESIVEQRICTLLRDQTTMLEASGTTTVAARKMLIANAADLVRRWPTLPASDRQALLHALIVRIDVGAEAIEISVRPEVLATVVTPDFDLRRSYFTRVFRLSFLAPEITTAIVQGRQPAELSAIKLLRAGVLARRWPDQRRQLGFD